MTIEVVLAISASISTQIPWIISISKTCGELKRLHVEMLWRYVKVIKANAMCLCSAPERVFAGPKRPQAVGVVSPSYNMEKVSYGLRPVGYQHFKILRVPFHWLERRGSFLRQTPVVLDRPVELLHTFNEIPLGQRPYVISFELELPRYLNDPAKWQLDFGYAALAQDRCRGLLALSEAAGNHFVACAAAAGYESLSHKVSVFRGAIMPSKHFRSDAVDYPRHWDQPAEGPLRVLFVGRDAYRKGLVPALEALEDCVRLGCDIEATIVSDFGDSSYLGGANVPDVNYFMERVTGKSHITHIEFASNARIREMMFAHDVFLFPSLDESLGWVAVEAGMASMPIITTDVFAIPELVSDGVGGMVIPLNKGPDRRWIGLRLKDAALRQEIETTFSTLRQGIKEALLLLASNRNLLQVMGAASRQHMSALYDYGKAGEHLADIYATAMG